MTPPRRGGPPAQNCWLERALSSVGGHLAEVRDLLMALAELERHELVLDLNPGTGLLTWEAVRRAPVGGVWVLAAGAREAAVLMRQAEHLDSLGRPVVLEGDLEALSSLVAAQGQGEVRFDVALGRNVLTRRADWPAAARAAGSVLRSGGRLVLAESVPRHGQRLYRLVEPDLLGKDLWARLQEAEEAVYADPNDPALRWDAADLGAALEAAGYAHVRVEARRHTYQQRISHELLAQWFDAGTRASRSSYAECISQLLEPHEVATVRRVFMEQLRERSVDWTSTVVYARAVWPAV